MTSFWPDTACLCLPVLSSDSLLSPLTELLLWLIFWRNLAHCHPADTGTTRSARRTTGEARGQRNREREGFTATGAAAAENIAAREGVGKCVDLDRERGGDPVVSERCDERAGNSEIGEGHGQGTALPFTAACAPGGGCPGVRWIAARKADAACARAGHDPGPPVSHDGECRRDTRTRSAYRMREQVPDRG